MSDLTDERLNSLWWHAELGHLDGQDYDAILDLVDEFRALRAERDRLAARVAQLEGADPLDVFEGKP